MKNTGKNVNVLNLMAFIGVIIIAVLEIFGFLARHDILTVGGTLVNFLDTLKNICILVVIGILLSDIALAFLDPRIRYSGGGR